MMEEYKSNNCGHNGGVIYTGPMMDEFGKIALETYRCKGCGTTLSEDTVLKLGYKAASPLEKEIKIEINKIREIIAKKR